MRRQHVCYTCRPQGCWDLADNSSWEVVLSWLRQSKRSLLLVLENAETVLHDQQRTEVGLLCVAALRAIASQAPLVAELCSGMCHLTAHKQLQALSAPTIQQQRCIG